MTATLVLIDMQQGADDPYFGRRGQPDAEANTALLLTHWREQGNPVVHIRNDSLDPNSPYSPNRPGNAFKAEVKPLEHEPVVEKHYNNAFVGTDLMQVLEEFGNTDLVVCGIHLENCVDATVRMAGNLGFLVYLAADCTVSVDRLAKDGKKWPAEEVHALTLAILDGEYAKVVESTDLMAQNVQ